MSNTLDNDFKNLSVNGSKKRKSPNTVTQLEPKRSRRSYTVQPATSTIDLNQVTVSSMGYPVYQGEARIQMKKLFRNIWRVAFPDGSAVLVKKSTKRECQILDALNSLRLRLLPLRKNVCNFVFGKRLIDNVIVMEAMDGDFLQLYKRHTIDLEVVFDTIKLVCDNCICLKKVTGWWYTDVKSENILYRKRGSSLEICLGDYEGLGNDRKFMFTYLYPGFLPDNQVRDIHVIWPLFITLLEGVFVVDNIDHTLIVNLRHNNINDQHILDITTILKGSYKDIWNTLMSPKGYQFTLADFSIVLDNLYTK